MSLRKPFTIDPQPNKEYRFQVNELHNLYVAEYGNPQGIPAVFFHGGPGDGCNYKKARSFDPKRYRIILIDQRGSGKSTPAASISDNTTFALVDDMDFIRKKLQIEKWVILGSSWGSTLALLYTQKYPQHVAALVVRGILLAREEDLNQYLSEGTPATIMNKGLWETFKSDTEKLFQQSQHSVVRNEKNEIDYAQTYYDFLTKTKEEKLQLAATEIYNTWVNSNLALEPRADAPKLITTTQDVQKLILELSYKINKFYLQDYDILSHMNKITDSNIKVNIVQGRYDLICPANQAYDLKKALPHATLEIIAAGHLSEPITDHTIVNVTDAIADRLLESGLDKNQKFAAKNLSLFQKESVSTELKSNNDDPEGKAIPGNGKK